jgi:hypothetical protein
MYDNLRNHSFSCFRIADITFDWNNFQGFNEYYFGTSV